MRHRQPIGHDQDRHNRGAHAGVLLARPRRFEDLHVGEMHGGPQEVAAFRQRGIEAERPRLVDAQRRLCIAALQARPDELDDRIDRHARRDFSGVVAAHAVGHDTEAEALVDDEVVLVGRSDATLVGHTMCAQHGTHHTG